MESLGTRLMRERKRRNLTLEDISVATKIRIQYLAAIEQESFDQLPGGVISKGFIRAYARELAMDEQQAIAEYLATITAKDFMLDHQEPAEPPIRSHKKPTLATELSWGVFTIALVVLAFGFVILAYYKRELQSWNRLTTNVSTQLTREKGEADSPQGGIKGATGSFGGSNASVPIGLPSSENFYVRIQAHEDAWLSINVDGKRIMHDTLVAMAEKTVEGRNLIVIRAGNVGALDFSFNRQTLPKLGDYDQAKTLIFGPNGLQHPAAPPISLPVTAASVEQ